jgi:lysyl-tRNA synthetase class I
MELKDIPFTDDCKYIESCENCGRIIEVRAQEDNLAEYSTDIYIKCTCGNYVSFSLPVN